MIFFMALVLAAPGTAFGETTTPVPERIILISIDDLRADRNGFDGYRGRGTTPNLDRLAADGVVFERAFSQATWTLPSHASMLTSLYASSHGACDAVSRPDDPLSPMRIVDEAATLPQVLKGAGYVTAGLYSGGYVAPWFGFSKGFDSYEERHYADIFGAAAQWALAHRDRRFFLFVHSFRVHEYRQVAYGSNPGSELKCPPRMAESRQGGGSEDFRMCGELSFDYDNMIYCTDSEIADFLARLGGAGLLERALIIVTSDHGENICGNHSGREWGIFGHRGPAYEEQSRVPLIMRFPGRAFAGRRVAELAQTIDIMPTILEAARVPAPANLQGSSLLSRLEGRQMRPPAGDAFAEGRNWLSVRTDRFKYILFSDGKQELYDLLADPQEASNLATTRPADAAALREKLRRFAARGRLGYHLVARGGPGRRFTVRIESERPILFFNAPFAKKKAPFKSMKEGRRWEATFLSKGEGDVWLDFGTSRESARLTIEVLRDGKAIAARETVVGGHRLAQSDRPAFPLELGDPAAQLRVQTDGYPPEGEGTVFLWKTRAGVEPQDPAKIDERAKELLRAAGYLQ